MQINVTKSGSLVILLCSTTKYYIFLIYLVTCGGKLGGISGYKLMSHKLTLNNGNISLAVNGSFILYLRELNPTELEYKRL